MIAFWGNLGLAAKIICVVAIGFSLLFILRIWLVHRRERFWKKMIWSFIVFFFPVFGWIFFGAFFKPLASNTVRARYTPGVAHFLNK